MTPEQMWTDVAALIPESTTPSQVRTMLDRAWRLSASVRRRASEMSKARGDGAIVEVTDELLLEAARFANESERFTSPADKLSPERELECAKKAMREDCVMTWYRVCRAYVNGAQRSSRKP